MARKKIMLTSDNKLMTEERAVSRKVNFLVSFYRRWKYRSVDPDLCCCGQMMSHTNPSFDSICQHAGGCRSMKDYLIKGN